MALPLTGLVLVETSGAGAPPALRAAIGLCGRMAADMGAAVTRVVTDAPDAAELPFLHAGKHSLRACGPDGPRLLAGLASHADLLVCDMEAAAMPGLSPRRVCAEISMDGTAAGDAADSEFTIEARAGLLDIVGDPARSPLRLGGHQTAYATGLAAFTAMMGALCQPAGSGGPANVRVSLLETAIWLNWKSLAIAHGTGRSPKRRGPQAEWPVLPCADGYVAVVHRLQEWPRLMALVDTPDIRAERFQTTAGRARHRVELNAILAAYFITLTRAEIHVLSLQHKLPFGAVWSPAELFDDPQMMAREMFRTVPWGQRTLRLPRLPALWIGAAA